MTEISKKVCGTGKNYPAYTKGEWEYSVLKDTQTPATLFVNQDGTEIDIAVFEKWEQDWAKEEMKANACLIVAAPALLEACKEGRKRLAFLQKKIVEAKLIIMDGVEIRKTASCVSFIEAVIAEAKE